MNFFKTNWTSIKFILKMIIPYLESIEIYYISLKSNCNRLPINWNPWMAFQNPFKSIDNPIKSLDNQLQSIAHLPMKPSAHMPIGPSAHLPKCPSKAIEHLWHLFENQLDSISNPLKSIHIYCDSFKKLWNSFEDQQTPIKHQLKCIATIKNP